MFLSKIRLYLNIEFLIENRRIKFADGHFEKPSLNIREGKIGILMEF
jgi:hypothetical protein